MTDGATPSAGPGPAGAEAGRYHFGDLLALARRSWVSRLSARVASDGFVGYRRSDAVLLRILASAPTPIGHLGEGVGISRQAARKLADGLVARGYAELAADPADARRRLVRLSERGRAYHRSLRAAIESLDAEVRRLAPSELQAADAVLRSVLTDEDRRLADAAVRRPGAGRP